MILRNEIIVIVLLFLDFFFYIRGFIYGIKRYQLNNSAYKKRKKSETFKEWLFYSRYKKEIPKALIILYYAVLVLHPLCLSLCILSTCVIKTPIDIGKNIVISLLVFDLSWSLTLALLFWSTGPSYAYSRWISKRRGQKTKKK